VSDLQADGHSPVKSVGSFNGVFGALFTLVIWLLLITAFQYFGGIGSSVGNRLLSYSWFIVPPSIHEHIQQGGFFGLMWLMLLASAYWVLIAAAACASTYGVSRLFVFWKQEKKGHPQELERQPVLKGTARFLGVQSDEARIVIRPMVGGPEFRDVFPAGELCLSMASLNVNRPPKTALESFEYGLMQVLVAHKDWTSDPDGHHANVGLMEHSENVARKMEDLVPNDPLARPLGLAHDLGKILAYAKRKDDHGKEYWEKKTIIQDRLSAQLVRMLPQFRELPELERNTINIVLTYTHSPGKLPRKSTSVRARTLLEKLREADGLTSAQDRQKAQDNAGKEGVILDILRVIPDAIAALNINQALHPGANADGWTLMALDYVAVQEQQLREGLRGLVSESTAAAISLNAENYATPVHPAAVAIREALERMGLVMKEFNGTAPEEALFSIRVFKHTFNGIFLLNRERLGQVLGNERLERWGDSKYELKVLGASGRRSGA
jgi:hypothetical protein